MTERVGLHDRSERGKLALSGPDAKEFLHGQVSQDILSLTPGHGAYAALLTPKGKMLGDLRVLDAGPPSGELLLDTERVALQALFNTIRRFSLGYSVQLHKRTLERGLLSLVGPLADELVAACAQPPAAAEALGPQEHDHAELTFAGVVLRAIRTDVGIDLLMDSPELPRVRAAALEAGAVAVDEAVLECLRIERGRPRYGVDLDETVIPQEAGLNERAVSFTKGCYVGQETVARLYYRGKPNRELRGLRSQHELPVGAELRFEGRSVGRISSATLSPRHGAIALALVRREAPPGTVVQTDGHGEAVVCELPFR
ncbi:MAG TPA: glycine cleavage T C-terminal barrel domain-containing protein [Solirubrobacteraceae bacterium]|nr:glycine cleavage T C-terminal barrel domain-containing protein [Solirubrobacteraceae bacterium]